MYPPEFAHRFRLTIGYVILVVAVVAALMLSLENQQRIERESKANAEQVAAEAREDAVELCKESNELKGVILTLTERLSDGEGRTDFTKVPGFEDLDPAMQRYLQVLSTPSDGEGRTVTIAREVLAPKDCTPPEGDG